MEQKLYYLDNLMSLKSNADSCEIEYPLDLKQLLEDGWRIVKISAYGYGTPHGNIRENSLLLLQRGE